MSERYSTLVTLLAELRRRKVVQAGLVYLGSSFVALSAADVVVETYRLPEAVQGVFGVLVAVGFPVALVLAWIFDWTEDGIVRTERSAMPPVLRRWLFLGATLLVGSLTMAAVVAVVRPPSPGADATGDQAPVLGILPFEQASANPGSQSWLGPALEARVEDALSATPGFTLRSRRALAAYRDRGLPVDSLAALLDIDYFVHGTLSHSTDTVVLVIQLTEAATSTVVGSATVRHHVGAPLALLGGLAERIEEVLRPALGRAIRLREWHAATRDPLALELRYRAEERAGAAESLLGIDPVAAVREFAASDSLLALSRARDPQWVEPLLARASLAERHAVAAMIASAAREPARVESILSRGMAHADELLRLRPGMPQALALRGQLLWRSSVLGSSSDGPDVRVEQAERDLREALRRDPTLAAAAATLSELLFNTAASYGEARHFAELAYRQDAYLRETSDILYRIAVSAFELGDDADAATWCREGIRRFPQPPVHYACALQVMAWGSGPADPDSAWSLLDAIRARTDRANQATVLPYYTLTVAGVLARAGLPDSALAVVQRVRATSSIGASPHLLAPEAAVRYRAGQLAAARRLFEMFQRLAPEEARVTGSLRMLRPVTEMEPRIAG